MGTVTDAFVALVISVAPLLGSAISRFANEELAAGKKWFLITKKILFVIIAFIFLLANKWQVWHVTIGLLVVFAYLAFDVHRWWLVWALLGAAYALTAQQPLGFLLSASIFLYGLLTGSVLAAMKKIQGAIAAGAVFLAVTGVLLFIL